MAILGTLDDRELHRPPKTALSGRAMRDAYEIILGWTRKLPYLRAKAKLWVTDINTMVKAWLVTVFELDFSILFETRPSQ